MSSAFDQMKEMAAKQVRELLNNPAHQAAMNFFEELERNSALKMLHKQMSQQARNTLFEVSGRAMKELDHLMADEHLRVWERQVPDWALKTRAHTTPALDLMLGNFREAERLRSSLLGFGARERAFDDFTRVAKEAVRRVEMSGLAGLKGWPVNIDLSREFSDLFRSLPPGVSETLLGQMVEKLDAVRESAKGQDSEKFYEAFESLFVHLLAWIGRLAPHILTTEMMFNLALAVVLAVAQTGVSYKWRVDDQRDSQHRQVEQEKRDRVMEDKLDAIHSALEELKRNQKADIGKPYQIERTTAVFARPGSKRQPVGYVFEGQSVRAVATTGRWIFIEYADPFNLELRAGWIRKKYASLER
jgi:hypothetical protein